jgi:hypothetical protein
MNVQKRFRKGLLVEYLIDGVPQAVEGYPPAIKATHLNHRVTRPGLSIARPGDLFSIVIFKITGKRAGNCGPCAQHVKDMNKWGWLGCWTHRTEIATWLAEEARRRGHQINQSSALDLLKAAFKELLTNRTPRSPHAGALH